ncbi:helix-turn-helix transcriptional regulator [Phenylobacterium sp.]|uniref:helix-turn-helix transcriptional regulator n=1 Tax=Phenylobacterium sp. TaxID=1871053 RepID=UPI0037C5A337
MRASRLLSILILLQLRGRVSAQALAAEFEVSVRTLYRDMDALSAAGVPVYAERGRNGGFALLDGYRTRLTGLSPSEAAGLPLSPAVAAGLGLAAEARAAQRKLLTSLPLAARGGALRIAERVHLDLSAWFAPAQAPVPPDLAEAVWSARRVALVYESWRGRVERRLDPLGLVVKAGVWYLVGRAEGPPRIYRVDAIETLQVLDERFEHPRDFDLSRFWIAAAGGFETRQRSGRAIVELTETGWRLMRDWLPAMNPRALTDAGEARVEITIEDIAFSARELLRLGAEVRVISPPELARAVIDEARRVIDVHGGD